MGTWLKRRMHWIVRSTLFALLASYSVHALAIPTYELANGKWSLISLPADPGSGGTARAFFADDLPVDRYGIAGGWYIFALDAGAVTPRQISLNETMKANTGYWMLQSVADSVTLDLPESQDSPAGEDIAGCPQGQLCSALPLSNSGNSVTWNLVGFSSEREITLGDTRFVSTDAICSAGCTPLEAGSAGIVSSTLFRYNPDNAESPFEPVIESSQLRPWEGYWLATLPSAGSVSWVLPVAPAAPDPGELQPPPPEPVVQSAEIDAVRLLMQGSFGPSTAAIERVLTLGGPAAWVDEQLALPASLHLPSVNAQFPDGDGKQQGRYNTFWDRAINADDQLRQRVAFALSEIMVISDKSNALNQFDNLTTAYYDLLVAGAFGNYRNLLEAVTLSPAMGVFLSSLGNNKPDETIGRRADENYAREAMQLFSIGLVGLNIDGSERAGENTYAQSDVESFARVLTGWSWDTEKWSTDPRNGWKPDFSTREKAMVNFPEHHDPDAKQFLGMTIPAGQSGEADLKMALDRLFNHPNVGPFIGKQLIKRLVTSNPSPGYVQRVATMFNDNGSGVRGDLGAVVRAIVLDQEAREQLASETSESGKLRESILRYAHALRAFRVTEAIEVKRYVVNQVPQLAPLTAPSVFNFFSPSYAPLGAISNANLVAPEFQLNSESNVNRVNKALMRIFINNIFHTTPVTPNLTVETGLLSNPEELISHLDLLLTAGTLTDTSRQVLTDYIETNQGAIENERLVQDVVSLIVSSTEFAIQR